ncbi:HlyD family secretion protein [Corallococcus sp. M34]|uniref:biotin/lipoyl-containing protein n=1 Tax=Citreicoccus inhibens TaxID=2849499 RepID=UPI001315A0F7|nr:biotin/lipoyl-containing protein [Citreicoccus inhibens]MBU8894702.1 HlyD family secretion protein [Citreicoccus inhibens]
MPPAPPTSPPDHSTAPRPRRWGWIALPLVALLVGGALLCARQPGDIQGGVLVQLGDRLAIEGGAGGHLQDVLVGPGQHVEEGQVLARLVTQGGPVELTAPQAGVVGDVRVSAGDAVRSGELLMWLVVPNALPALVALFPERYRGELAPGMTLRYRIPGIPSTLETTIESVEPPEAARALSQGQPWPGLTAGEAAVLVRAHVPSRTYLIEGRTHVYMDGMMGKAQVPRR